MISLDEESRDALLEIFNIGVGRSAVALSQMINAEVALSIPDFEVLKISQIAARIAAPGQRACVVQENFRQGLDGNAMMVFTENEGLSLIARLLDSPFPLDKLAEAEAEALSEVGNIILNACLAQVADALGVFLETTLPVCSVGGFESFTRNALASNGSSAEDAEAFLLKINLIVKECGIMGYLIFLLDFRSVSTLRGLLTAFVMRLSPDRMAGASNARF